jgi:hypothetical protein
MNDTELERLRRRYGGGEEKISPPDDLLARLKNDIPDHDTLRRSDEPRGAGLDDHPAAWRLAASVLMLFGFANVGARIFHESRHDRYASYPPSYAATATRQKAAAEEPLEMPMQPPSNAAAAPPVQLKDQGTFVDSVSAARKESARLDQPSRRQPQIASTEVENLSKSDEFTMPTGTTEGAVAQKRAEERDREYIEDAVTEVTPSVTAAAPAAPPPAAAADARANAGATARAAAPKPQSAIYAPEPPAEARGGRELKARLFKVGGDVQAPRLLHDAPLLVTRAETKRYRSAMTVDIVVKRDGTVGDVTMIDVPEALRERVLETLREWRYRPASREGEAVDVTIRTHVRLAVE